MAYVSLYRKYRSRDFDNLVGQNHITTTLKNAITRNRIGHAYLFSGPRGTGKTSTARIFSKALNCTSSDGPTPTPCNKCDACTAIATDSMFDVIEIDAASNRGIDDIRELREKVRVPPAQARYKVYIIDEVHMLTKEAFNALLKTLEEPPPNVVFMLATTEPQKLLSTILSRCQRYDFRRLTDAEIAGHLSWIASNEDFTIEEEALNTIVKAADGSMRDSISLLDQLVSFSDGRVLAKDVNDVFGLVEKKEIGSFMNAVFSGDTAKAFELFDSFFQAGKSFSLFIRLLLEYIRDLYLVKQKIKPASSAYSKEEIRVLLAQANATSRETLVGMLDELARVEDRIRWENYPRIILEVMVVKMLDMVSGPGLADDTAAPAGAGDAAELKEAPAPEPAEVAQKQQPPQPQPRVPDEQAPGPQQPPKPAEKKRPSPLDTLPPAEPPARDTAPPPQPDAAPAPPPTEQPAPADTDDAPDFEEEPLPPEPGPAPAPKKRASGDPRMMDIPAVDESRYPPVEDDVANLPETGDEELDRMRGEWTNILAEARGINLPAWFQLKKGAPVKIENGAVMVEFGPQHEFQRIKSSDPMNVKALEKAMEKVLGTDYSVHMVSTAAEDKAAEDKAAGEKAGGDKADDAAGSPGGLELETQKTEAAAGADEPAGKKDEKVKKKKSGGPQLADLFEEVFPESKEIN